MRLVRDTLALSITSAIASAWERTPWHATQRAAWEALKKAESNAECAGPPAS